MHKHPVCFIIAGPNGAGKTTFAQEFLPREAECPIFVNADLIAAGLSPFAPGLADIRAGRLMLEEIGAHVAKLENFAFETTLSGRHYARTLPDWQAKGYKVKLVFLSLADVKLAIERVRVRVKQGGHNVPDGVIRRRYEAGWENFEQLYKNLVDCWLLYDNSGSRPILIDTGGKT